jgi:hypothetical protein
MIMAYCSAKEKSDAAERDGAYCGVLKLSRARAIDS